MAGRVSFLPRMVSKFPEPRPPRLQSVRNGRRNPNRSLVRVQAVEKSPVHCTCFPVRRGASLYTAR